MVMTDNQRNGYYRRLSAFVAQDDDRLVKTSDGLTQLLAPAKNGKKQVKKARKYKDSATDLTVPVDIDRQILHKNTFQ
ncbi:hypothetical protein DPMN_137058 [Dreissena polymorpha]|uniref:Uncharacterized protein n=1 Tax=Dreissena polymorpha TaxID=45954 RepID=A0A9D4JD93_DREPO|nr:hypothetical protein DPMN_137058 [Dreissena polymorpha]